MNYKTKYLKYKLKYSRLKLNKSKKMKGGLSSDLQIGLGAGVAGVSLVTYIVFKLLGQSNKLEELPEETNLYELYDSKLKSPEEDDIDNAKKKRKRKSLSFSEWVDAIFAASGVKYITDDKRPPNGNIISGAKI